MQKEVTTVKNKKLSDYKKQWWFKNKDKQNAKKRQQNKENPFPNRERARLWRINNPERYKEQMMQWRTKNLEYKQASDRSYYYSSGQRVKMMRKRYRIRQKLFCILGHICVSCKEHDKR